MGNFFKHLFLGALLGFFMLLFFIALDANAMEVKQGTLYTNVRDSDIIGIEIDASNIEDQYVKIQYLNKWVDQYQFDGIGENYERVGNTYKVFSGKTYHKSNDLWFEVEYATTTLEEFQKATLEPDIIGLLKFIIPTANAQETIYSEAGDGSIESYNASWATAKGGSGFTVQDSNALDLHGVGDLKNVNYYFLQRAYLPFDTSVIGAGDVISATLYVWLYSTANGDNDEYAYVNVVESEQAETYDLSSSDWTISDFTKLSDTDIDISDASTGQYQNFVFNSNGTSSINVSGNTMLALLTGHDIENVAPDQVDWNSFQIYKEEQSGTANDPYLLIEIEEEEEAATSTSVSIPCDLIPNNELSMAVWCVEEWGDSTTSPEKTYYGYAHIPFFIWFIIAIPTLWLASRLLLEFIIRLRRY